MSWKKHGVLTLLFMVIGIGQVFGAATVTSVLSQVPKGAYVNGPGGAADDNYYYQAIHITVGGAHATAAPAITITMPTDMTVADTDGDVGYADEISISYSTAGAGTCAVNAGSTASSVRITIAGAAIASGDDIWIMFPVETAASPTVGQSGYAIDFADNTNDADIASSSGPQIYYRDAGALEVVSFLTNLSGDNDSTSANSYIGLHYPSAVAATYGALPDFVLDSGETQAFGNVVTAADANNTNDITYTVWVSADSTLSHIVQYQEGVLIAQDYDTPGNFTQNEGAADTDTYYTGGLPEGSYYFFITSSLTGDFPLCRSGKLTVTHYPLVNLSGWDRTGNGFDNSGGHADDASVTLDTGSYYDVDGAVPASPNSSTDIDLYISVDDLDDNARLYVFYSTDSGITQTSVTTSGSSPSIQIAGLTGATALVDTLYENKEDMEGFVSWNWSVIPVGSSYVPAGDCTIYVIACDGKHYSFLKAKGTDTADTETINIRHSPSLTVDALTEYNLGSDTGNNADVTVDPGQSDVIMISWGKAGITGAKDIDDSATIEFYIDYDTGGNNQADYGSTSAAAIRTAAASAESPTGTHRIFSGMYENLKSKNMQYYAWNLKDDFKSTGWYPTDEAAGGGPHRYHVYAIIDENKTGGTARVVALGDDGIVTTAEVITTIEFENDVPFVRLYDPPAEGVTVNGEQVYQMNFEAFDFDTDGDIGIFIVKTSALPAGPLSTTTATLSALATGNAYCLTDDDGNHAAGQSWLSENSVTSYDMTIRLPGGAVKYTDDMIAGGTDITDDTYWVYIGVDPIKGNNFAAGTEVLRRAPGTLKLINVANTISQKNLTISPMAVSVAKGDTVTFSVMAADEANTVDLIDIYIAAEKSYWTVVSSSAPFTDTTGFGTLIANTVIDDATNNRWILRATVFNAGNAIDPANTGLGDTVASFRLVSSGTTVPIDATTSVYYINEPAHGWVTKFANDGSDVSVKTLSSTVKVVPRPIIEGIVEFEGRSTSAYTMTFELRKRGSYVAYNDSVFTNANDTNTSLTGIQYVLDSDGKFTLTKAPIGEWDLIATYNRYLAKKIQVGLNAGVDTLFVNFGILLGGDAVGYTDSSGAAYPDNQIDTADISRISTAFLATPTNTKWSNGTDNWKWADINEDNIVEVADLAMATAHVGQTGAQPVYKTAGEPGEMMVEFTNLPTDLTVGTTYAIPVVVHNASNVRGYFINVMFDENALDFSTITNGDFIATNSYSFPVIGEGTVGLANAMYGSSLATGDGIIAEIRFTARSNQTFDPDMLVFSTATFVTSDFMKMSIITDQPTTVSGNDIPGVFKLNQNFPNPFNPTTTISFSIPENNYVSMKIYDILGRNVRTMVSGYYESGNHSVVWNATDMNGNPVSAGVYFYTVKSGSYQTTKRMLFLK